MNKPIIIIGNGGHALVLTELLKMNNQKILGFTAPQKQPNAFGLAYLGNDESILNYNPNEIELVLGIGSLSPNNIRIKIFNLFKEKGYTFKTCIHTHAIISPTAVVEEGAQIMAGVVIQPFAQIKKNTIINTGVKIDHECTICENVHIAPGSVLSGNVHIDNNVHVGTNSTIIQGIHIGEATLVAAGSVVTKNIKDHCKVMGIPAKEVK